MGFHYIPAAVDGAVFSVPQTEVFDGSANTPIAWTDLDLSAVVGSNHALVYLSVYRGANDCGSAHFRKNGATRDWELALTRADIWGEELNYTFLVPTDSAGIIEWHTVVAVLGVHVIVEAYIK